MSVLEVSGVVAGYGKIPIIRDVDLRVEKGETLAVIGPNGSGKSTLAKTVVGLTTLFSGSIRFDGIEVTGLPPERRALLGIGYLPQTRNVFPDLTVQENLEMGGYHLGRHELQVRMKEVLELFPEIRGRLSQRAGTMSGGERQMVAMARLLMMSPKLVILDEPSAGLAPKLVERVYQKIDAMRAMGLTIVLIEQHAVKALKHSDRTVVMVGGRIALSGPSPEISRADLRSVFFQTSQR
ncbi:MAG: ABC transporter ATP-binding protein [Nitrososphaerota archaeon]|nr:ABC transporter ATP-binding protein [Candidatus Calditenuis fumarioli]